MIAHHGIGTDIDGELLGQTLHALNDPGLAMVEILSG
jgi:hypothetical protein